MRILDVFPVGLLLSLHSNILRIVRKKKPNLRKKHLYGDYLVGKRIELVDDYLLTIIHARER